MMIGSRSCELVLASQMDRSSARSELWQGSSLRSCRKTRWQKALLKFGYQKSNKIQNLRLIPKAASTAAKVLRGCEVWDGAGGA